MPRCGKVPRYLLHKSSGQARVIIAGRTVYLGKFGSDESHAAYQRVLTEWRATHAAPRSAEPMGTATDLTITELIAAYWEHLVEYLGDTGRRRGSANNQKATLRTLRQLYGDEAAAEFGPLKLVAIQQHWIDTGAARAYINEQTRRVKALFRWAVSRELIPPAVYHGLVCVAGIRRGRTQAKEGRKIRPVADNVVDATVGHLAPVLAAMVRLLRITGMRAGELCRMRPADVDRSGPVWVYVPTSHKTDHLGKDRSVPLGPKAQAVLMPFLLRPAEAFCFSPQDSERRRLADLHARRKTPLSCGNKPRGRLRRNIKDHFTSDALRTAIQRVCEKHGIERWHTHQLRHTRATELRRQFGVEGAQLILGHAKTQIIDVYAEKDLRQAMAIAEKTG